MPKNNKKSKGKEKRDSLNCLLFLRGMRVHGLHARIGRKIAKTRRILRQSTFSLLNYCLALISWPRTRT